MQPKSATRPAARSNQWRLSWQSASNPKIAPPFEVTSKRRRSYPSETQVKTGVRMVHGRCRTSGKARAQRSLPLRLRQTLQAVLPEERQIRRQPSGPLLSGRGGDPADQTGCPHARRKRRTASVMPYCRASAVRPWPMETSRICGMRSSSGGRLPTVRSCPALRSSP